MHPQICACDLVRAYDITYTVSPAEELKIGSMMLVADGSCTIPKHSKTNCTLTLPGYNGDNSRLDSPYRTVRQRINRKHVAVLFWGRQFLNLFQSLYYICNHLQFQDERWYAEPWVAWFAPQPVLFFLEGNCRVPCCRQLDGPCSHISHEGSQSDSVGFGAIAEVLQVLSTLHPVIPVHHTRTK